MDIMDKNVNGNEQSSLPNQAKKPRTKKLTHLKTMQVLEKYSKPLDKEDKIAMKKANSILL